MAVAYIDLQTIGEVSDRSNPTGPLGGLGELPETHRPVSQAVDLAPYQFGMTDNDILEILNLLQSKRVLILKAGTGTGKSTFAPFRLLNPPNDAAIRLADYGPIIVTEPRVQATIGVARFVGEKLVRGCQWRECSVHGAFEDEHPDTIEARCIISDCARHIGPGFPVGYQVKGDKNHDDSCQLIYATDGTVINWLREGRLSKIGAVVVDEAHERSSNIDFILGFLKRELDRYPHLRVIITSATFDVNFYVDYFGGPERVAWKDVPSVKSFGYGAPLFPIGNDEPLPCSCADPSEHGDLTFNDWLTIHWPVRPGPLLDDGYQEDLWDTTRQLHELRFDKTLPLDDWRHNMPDAVAQFVINLVQELDRRQIYGDILAFLATEKTITPVVDRIRKALAPEQTDVYPLLATAEASVKEAALAARGRDERRKVVVSTNIAETSVTVQGVRFVVDSGLICQEEWNPTLATGDFPTKPHSQSGLQQRWGRVGRDAPGWVFPLYSKAQFASLPRETPPGSTRANLEQLVMKAKAGGVDDPLKFPWPAAHIVPDVELDESAEHAIQTFQAEIVRSIRAARSNGVLDADGDLTPYGKELERFSGLGSAAFAVAVMYADQLACLPEIVTALALLENTRLVGAPKASTRYLLPESFRWPTEWRVRAHLAHRALSEGCRDDLDLALRIASAWERADPDRLPWQDSDRRREWAANWWIDHELIRRAVSHRRDVLSLLSPRMKQEAKRQLEPRLFMRTRAVLSHALQSLQYQLEDDGSYRPTADPTQSPVLIEPSSRLSGRQAGRVVALRRRLDRDGIGLIGNLIEVLPWAVDTLDPIELVRQCALHCAPRSLSPESIDPLADYLAVWPTGARFLAAFDEDSDGLRLTGVRDYRAPYGYTQAAAAAADESEEDGGEDDTDDLGVEGRDQLDSLVAESDVAADEAAEIDVRWPGGTDAPEEDEEVVERLTVLDPEDPETGLEENDDDELAALAGLASPVDIMATWRERATGTRFGQPQVIVDHAPDGESWFVCTGYQVGDGARVAVVLEPDWLAPDITGDPSLHPDLEIGTTVQVIVGPTVSDGQARFRVFYREDRRGRFLVPEQSNPRRGEAPVALDPRDSQLIANLVEGAKLSAVVVPGPANTRTISLLPTLSKHVDNAARSQLVPPGRPGGSRASFWPAVVTDEPAEGRWARVELIHKDESVGFRHAFGIPPFATVSDDVLLSAGTEVMVQLVSDRRPALSGRPTRLAEVALKHDHHVVLRNEDGTKPLELRARRPLSYDVVRSLLAGTTGADWSRRVWNFYLASHQRQVRAVLPGQPPASPPPAPTAAYEQFRSGMLVNGKIGSVGQNGLTILLADGVTGFAGGAGVPPGHIYGEGEPVVARVHEVDPSRRRLMLDLRVYIVEATIPPYWRAAFKSNQSRIEQIVHAEVQVNSTEASARFFDRPTADNAVRALTLILNSPAARISVLPDKKGMVIGTGGQRIKRLQQLTGIWDLRFDGSSADLVVIAEMPETVREVVSQVALACTTVEATMQIPYPAANRVLLGKGGETIRRLIKQSGCTGAAKGDHSWQLRARTLAAVERFVELAEQLVSGCALTEVLVDQPKVVDLATNLPVADWETHHFHTQNRDACVLKNG
ncbi:DEAD/DEAH box helicase [Flindersiella endophytica]